MKRLWLFLLLAAMVGALVNPGNLGTLDTHRRLQVARWIYRGEPQVRPDDTEFGLTGKNGTRWAWYGIGQSLVLVPFDFVASAAVSPFHLDPLRRGQVTELLVAFLMQSLLAAAAMALAYGILIRLEFPPRAAMAGALALLFGTTFLFYIQNAQENNLVLVLALVSLYGVLRFRDEAAVRWAALAGCACGLALLTRLTSLIETAVFFGLMVSLGCDWRRWSRGFLPAVAAAFAIERWYQWYRFGGIFQTYARELADQIRPPGAPPSWPFSRPFWNGVGGTFFSPDKSILLYDPLLVLVIVVALWKWRKVQRSVRITVGWLVVLLAAYVVTYARYYLLGGDVSWGHRYMTVPVQLLALFAAPLLLRFPVPRAAWAVVCTAVVLQAASTALAPNVEVIQRERGDGHGVIVDRAVNLAGIAWGRADGPRFAGVPPEWRTLYYLPFQLRFRFPRYSGAAIACWMALLLAVPFVVRAAYVAADTRGNPR